MQFNVFQRGDYEEQEKEEEQRDRREEADPPG